MKCDCGHWKTQHLFDGKESCCLETGCQCGKFSPRYPVKLKNARGITCVVHCLCEFVERNQHMFQPADVEPRKCPSYKAGPHVRDTYCRAERGLRSLIHGCCESWKGWTLDTSIESCQNKI